MLFSFLSDVLLLSYIIDWFNARADTHTHTRMCTFRSQVFLSQGGHYECRRWKDDKELLLVHNPFAALPYIIDSENVVATAPASSAYLARKLGLTGHNESERSRNQQALAVVYELRDDAMRVLYGPTEVYAQGHRGHLERTVRAHYYKLNSWLEKHGTPYLASDAPGDCAGSFFCPCCAALLLALFPVCFLTVSSLNVLTVIMQRVLTSSCGKCWTCTNCGPMTRHASARSRALML
jgi:hypothetical protein